MSYPRDANIPLSPSHCYILLWHWTSDRYHTPYSAWTRNQLESSNTNNMVPWKHLTVWSKRNWSTPYLKELERGELFTPLHKEAQPGTDHSVLTTLHSELTSVCSEQLTTGFPLPAAGTGRARLACRAGLIEYRGGMAHGTFHTRAAGTSWQYRSHRAPANYQPLHTYSTI